MTTQSHGAQDPRRYLHVLWRRKWLLLAIVVVIPAAAYLVASRSPEVYEASTVVQIQPTDGGSSVLSNQPSFAASGVQEAARLIATTAVARLAAKELGDPPRGARSLLGAISVRTDDDFETGFLTITAQAGSPERAAGVANAFASAISESRTGGAIDELDETIATLTTQLERTRSATRRETIAEQIQQLRALRRNQSDATQVIEPAVAPAAAISPRPRRTTVVAGVLAILLAAGLIPLLEMADRRLREPKELEGPGGAPLLGTIPEAAFPGNESGPRVREAFLTLRAALTYFNTDRALTSVMITGPSRGDGKTTVATNLAVALAQDDRTVILVDCDLRRPQVATQLGIADRVPYGLEAVLGDKRALGKAIVPVDVGGGRLGVLAGGVSPTPSVLLGSERMRALIAKLSEAADMVVLDTPPLLAVSDALPLASQVTGTVMVARLNRTTRDELRSANRLVTNAAGTVLGVVATGIRTGRPYGFNGYGYGYGYETDEDAAELIAHAHSNGAAPEAAASNGGHQRETERSA